MNELAYTLGMMSGVFAMCMSLYMQFVARTQYAPRMVVLFWVFGMVLAAVNINVVTKLSVTGSMVQIGAYTVLIAVELYVASHVIRQKHCKLLEVADANR